MSKSISPPSSSLARRPHPSRKPAPPRPAKAKAAQKTDAEAKAAAGDADGDGIADAAEDDVAHRQRHAHGAHHARRHASAHDEVGEHDNLETAATSSDAVQRSHGGGGGGGDGFGDGGQQGREAYERYIRGTVREDEARVQALVQKGVRDDFDAGRSAVDVEQLGPPRASAHLVRLYEGWALDGVGHDDAIARAAGFLAGFGSTQNIRRVLTELESRPIREVYPLEVALRLLADRPELMPNVRPGALIGNVDELRQPGRVLAGRPTVLDVGADLRIKSFALLGGGRPGYEFHPHPEEGKFHFLVDTPGRWRFAVLGAPLARTGSLVKETGTLLLEVFAVDVWAMGKKGEPLTPAAWAGQQAEEGDDDIYDGGADVGGPAPLVIQQIRAALDEIVCDGDDAYSWDATFRLPGADGPPLLHVVVDGASAADPVWQRACDDLVALQRSCEPGRAHLNAEDLRAALRRSRRRSIA